MTSSRDVATRRPDVALIVRSAVAALLLAVSLLPLGEWLDRSFQRALAFQSAGWWSGGAAVALLSVLVWLVLRDDERAEAAARPFRAAVALFDRRPWTATIALGVLATCVYILVAWSVFDARPLLIDEIVQVLQARIFVAGRLWLPLDAYPEFRSIMHMVEQDGRWYGQFPPGGPAMLALGELVRAPWIVNPVCGGITVGAFATALRWGGLRTPVVLGASCLAAFAPFALFQASGHMNHVPALMWIVIAAAGLVRATSADSDHPVAGLVCGLGLGIAATIRPLDAAAFALPAAAWLCWRALRVGHWKSLVMSGVGVAVPMAAMMWVNAHTTGGALAFGYTVLWGESHGLGFHESPWGEQHNLTRAIALTAAYFNRLNEYMFEVPIPSLLAPLATLAIGERLRPIERYLLASSGLLVGAYFAYWHDGFYLGPRFFVPLVLPLAVLTAQLPSAVAARWGRPLAVRAVASTYLAAAVLGMALVLPHRARSYASGFQSLRWDYDRIARDAGATGDVILVRESWGAQVIARLWAIGVSRSFAEVLYRKVDTCGLDQNVLQLERSGVRGIDAETQLRPLLADSARVVASPFSPDATERVLPGSVYPPECWNRIEEDRAGYTHFAPTLLARDGSTRYYRDLHARDTLAVSLDRDRVWLLRRVPDSNEVIPVLAPLATDSLRSAWYGTAAVSSVR